MKYVLILVLFPTWSQVGYETHITYENMQECNIALSQINMDRDHFKVCVPHDQEFWYYGKKKDQ